MINDQNVWIYTARPHSEKAKRNHPLERPVYIVYFFGHTKIYRSQEGARKYLSDLGYEFSQNSKRFMRVRTSNHLREVVFHYAIV